MSRTRAGVTAAVIVIVVIVLMILIETFPRMARAWPHSYDAYSSAVTDQISPIADAPLLLVNVKVQGARGSAIA